MVKRIFEFILGVIVAISLFSSYGDQHHSRKLLIGYITSNVQLQNIITIGLIILASKLIAGKPKDYSKFFYNLFVKIFGLHKKGDK